MFAVLSRRVICFFFPTMFRRNAEPFELLNAVDARRHQKVSVGKDAVNVVDELAHIDDAIVFIALALVNEAQVLLLQVCLARLGSAHRRALTAKPSGGARTLADSADLTVVDVGARMAEQRRKQIQEDTVAAAENSEHVLAQDLGMSLLSFS